MVLPTNQASCLTHHFALGTTYFQPMIVKAHFLAKRYAIRLTDLALVSSWFLVLC